MISWWENDVADVLLMRCSYVSLDRIFEIKKFVVQV